jgi:putative ABC transport system permease protein
MIKNHLKIAWRNLMKNKIFSFINIFGLSVGLTCCMLISLYLYNEMNYDRYHTNINQLYQLGTTFVKDSKDDRTVNTPGPMAQAMKQEFPEIADATRLMALFAEDKTLIQYNEPNAEKKSFYERNGFMADSSFFRLFTYNFIEGNPATALRDPNTVVLSEEIAQKIFGRSPALNKVIHISSGTNGGDNDYIITGVFRPYKKPSHINAGFFLSFGGGGIEQSLKRNTSLATNNMFYTYFLLKPGAEAKQLENKFPAFVEKYIGKDLKAMGFYKKQFLIPVKDIHLHAGIPVDVTTTGSATYLYILASIALFTLLIACINFMNLATARSSKRSAEVGVRKVLGAEKRSLMKQFLGESVLMSLLAFILALLLTALLLPAFAAVSGKNILFSFVEHKWLLAGFLVLALFTGILAGIYPAVYMSSFKPLAVLKGKLTNSLAVVSMRKGLVVFQFVISVALIIASVVIMKQMNFLRSSDLGFNKDQQIVIPLRSNNAKNIYQSLKNEISRNKEVVSAGASFYYPGIFNPSDMGLYREGKTMNDAKLVKTNWVDNSFLQTLDIKPLAGRLFGEGFPADTSGRIIVNEKMVTELGFTAQEAIGKPLFFDWQGEANRFEIVGVVKDFHFKDLHTPIEPYGFFLNNRAFYNYLIVHAKTSDMKNMLAGIGKLWSNLNPNEPFEYSFMDQDFQKNYESETRLASLVSYFTFIAILICCLGLFGLAAFSAEQRRKEIGVRKVLGASIPNILSLLSKDFLKLVLIAIVIASPIAWWVMNKWLQDFAYRTNIGWTVFALAALMAVCIALLTISFQAIKAAVANPVKSLRTE